MPSYALRDLNQIVRSWGRGVVFYADRWSLSQPLALTHLGDTEGDIVVNTNPDLQHLTVPELTGPASHDADYMGENPTIDMPLYVADPDMLAILSPSGSAHAGRSRRSPVVERTIAIFPEQLFLILGVDGIYRDFTLDFDGTTWTLNSIPLDAAKLALLDVAFWGWRAIFNRPNRTFHGGGGDAKKNIETVQVTLMHHPAMPEGHHLYTTGDPADSLIALGGTS